MAKTKSIFKILKTAQSVKEADRKKTKVPTQKAMIRYILATMLFKHGTIMFVRNLDKITEGGKRLSRNQSATLKKIYTEWTAGKQKAVKARQDYHKANKAKYRAAKNTKTATRGKTSKRNTK